MTKNIQPLSTDEVANGYLRALRTNNALAVECPECGYVGSLRKFHIYDLRNPSNITPVVNRLQRQMDTLENDNSALEGKVGDAENELELAKETFRNKEAVYKERLNNPKNKEWEREIRSDALQRSKAIRIGTAVQMIAPWLGPVVEKYQPDELRVSNNPLDFIALEGLASKRIRHISFLEIKLNQSGLNDTEKSIKHAVEQSEVSFEVIHISPKQLPTSSPLSGTQHIQSYIKNRLG
jgi:predicted Holliday junction resolvase-like endonuclease